MGGALVESSTAYCDQAHTWVDLPPELDGALVDYVVVADADNAVGDYGLSITVDFPGTILLFIDPAVNVGEDMPWVEIDGYEKSEGINFTLDKGGSTVVFDLWDRDIDDTGDPILTGPQNDGDAHNYAVAYGTDSSDLSITVVDHPDPYVLGSGVEWVRTITVENLGEGDSDDVVVSLSGSGVTDFNLTGFNYSPNSTWNKDGNNKWQMETLDWGETATMTIKGILGPGQDVGTDVITLTAQIDSAKMFDPDLANNIAVETTSVFDVASALTGVSRTGTSTNCDPSHGGPLVEGSTAYCDQDYTWVDLPPELDGNLVDYIVVADADNSVGDYGLSFTVDKRGSILLFIDPAVNVGADMPWVDDDGYTKEEGINFTLDKGGSTVVFDVWVLETDGPTDPVVTGPQNNGGAHNYGVAYVPGAANLAVTLVDGPDPFIQGSGVDWTRTYTVEKLGTWDMNDVVLSIGATGISPGSTLVGAVETSPNSSFNQFGEFKWRTLATLEHGDSATMTIKLNLAPDQAVGTDVITSTVQIDSADIFDPDPGNNSASATTSVFDVSTAPTAISRTGSSANCDPALGGPLVEGSTAYCDQDYTWVDLPPEVDGLLIDYFVVADADNSVGDYGLSIDVDKPGTILLFIAPAVNVGADMPWVEIDGYEKEEGLNFTLDKGGSTVVFDLWVLDIDDTDDPILTGPQNNGGAHNYGVAYVTDAANLAVSLVADPDPYGLGSGVDWTRTYTIENLGDSDTDNVVVSLSGSGITAGWTLTDFAFTPNSTWDQFGQNKWRMAVLESGDTATLTIKMILGPGQTLGTDVITSTVQIDSSDILDPDPDNNMDEETTSVVDDNIHGDGFEDP